MMRSNVLRPQLISEMGRWLVTDESGLSGSFGSSSTLADFQASGMSPLAKHALIILSKHSFGPWAYLKKAYPSRSAPSADPVLGAFSASVISSRVACRCMFAACRASFTVGVTLLLTLKTLLYSSVCVCGGLSPR